MQIAPQKVVSIEYTLTDDTGEVLDSSEGGEPLAYIQGGGTLIPGLEKALAGKSKGDELEVVVQPDDAYGAHDEELIQNMPLRKLPDKATVGSAFQVRTPDGPRFIRVVSISGDYAKVDANHPLAGVTLHFKVKVVDVREPTEEELTHGHVHGAGGHDHGHGHDHDH